MVTHQMGVTRACGLIGLSRSLYRYEAKRPGDKELKERLCELAAHKRRYGYRRLHVLLRREGWQINRKRTYRVYHEAGLMVRKRKRKLIVAMSPEIYIIQIMRSRPAKKMPITSAPCFNNPQFIAFQPPQRYSINLT